MKKLLLITITFLLTAGSVRAEYPVGVSLGMIKTPNPEKLAQIKAAGIDHVEVVFNYFWRNAPENECYTRAYRVKAMLDEAGLEVWSCHLPFSRTLDILVLDPQRLRQVLLNLVGRAVRSVRDGSVVISAKFVMAEAASGHGELAVRIIAAGNAVSAPWSPAVSAAPGRPDSNTSFRSGSAAGWAAASNARAAPAGAVRSPSFSGNCRACRPRRRKRWSRRRPAGRGTTVNYSWMMYR